MDFDVAELQRLAQTDPAEFERRRLLLVEELIASAPPDIQRRLRGTQFRVELERGRASNALSATVRISRLMWESFNELREQLNLLTTGQPPKPAPASADILPFRRPAAD